MRPGHEGWNEGLEPYLTESELEPVATIVLGTVEGLHDIGKNLVAMMFRCRVPGGRPGVDVKPAQFPGYKNHKPQILRLSALLTTTMPVGR